MRRIAFAALGGLLVSLSPASPLRAHHAVGSIPLGLHATEDRLHTHDFHATLLHLLGLHHMQLVYRHKNRPERPTLNEGVVCEKIVNG